MEILKFGSQTPDNPIFFLHGFPGLHSKQNRDIAENVSRKIGRSCEVFLYDGLGFSPGEFSFRDCLTKVTQYIQSRIGEGIQSYDLVGHSWGGFQSLVICQEFEMQPRKLVLLSPLLDFPAARLSAASLAHTAAENPQIRLGDLVERERDFCEIAKSFPTEDLIRALNQATDVLILQAREDEVTPTPVAQSMLKHFNLSPRFELVDSDHSFLTGREKLASKIADFLN